MAVSILATTLRALTLSSEDDRTAEDQTLVQQQEGSCKETDESARSTGESAPLSPLMDALHVEKVANSFSQTLLPAENTVSGNKSPRDSFKVLKNSDPRTPPPPPRRRRSSIGYDNEKKGCIHYKRRSSLVATCCNQVVACRLCHDEFHESKSPVLTRKRLAQGNTSNISMTEVIHTIDRHDVRMIVCMECDHAQIPKQNCEQCGVCFGKYFCEVCNFFDDDVSKKQFHCDKCGICRVGGRENFFHCDKCDCCYAKSLENNHQCVERAMHANCPVCQEFLFSSIKGGVVMECGHVIHTDCFDGLLKAQISKCPLCNKSILSREGRSQQNQALKLAVRETPLPEEFKDRVVKILCNECEKRSEAKFHFVGIECGECGSFNTSQIR